MPKIRANGITFHYEQQGSGEPLILLPFLSAENGCYAFQLAEYSKHFTCISLDLRGTGESDKPAGVYSTELFADDVAAVMQALGIRSAHVMGVSLGAATGMHLAAKYPEKVKSLSLHSAWPKTDAFLKPVVATWRLAAQALGSVPETTIQAIFPWCFTPELYAERHEFLQSLADFVRSRPAQPVAAFLQHADAVLAHDAEAQLDRIAAPTQITFGNHDLLTSTRFAKPMKQKIRNSEVLVFEGCSHGALYEKVEEFNRKTLEFLLGRAAAQSA